MDDLASDVKSMLLSRLSSFSLWLLVIDDDGDGYVGDEVRSDVDLCCSFSCEVMDETCVEGVCDILNGEHFTLWSSNI